MTLAIPKSRGSPECLQFSLVASLRFKTSSSTWRTTLTRQRTILKKSNETGNAREIIRLGKESERDDSYPELLRIDR